MFTCDLYINICAHTRTHTPFILETVHVVLFRSEWDYEVLRTGGGVDERGHRGERERPVSMFRVTELHIFLCLHTGILMRDVHKAKRGSERTGIRKFRIINF